MACLKTLLGLSTALIIAAGASAQTNTVVEPATQFDNNVVRAQFIKPGDVSPEEYQALLDEADKIRAFQNSRNNYGQGAYTGISQATTAQTSGSQFVTDSHGYQIELFEAPVTTVQTMPINQPVPVTTRSAVPAGTVIAATTPSITYRAPIMSKTQASHYVVKGDTLYNIAKRNNVTVSALKAANGMTNNTLKLGQTINLPSQTVVTTETFTAPVTTASNISVTQPAATPRSTTLVRNVEPIPTSNIYAVLPKDTLYGISRRACVSVGDITAINNIGDAAAISPGQRITLPAGHCLK
ncbi:LysM peptidoglycan-binding domain-containing protein [Fretibacter rubidus]|uniref:lytic transglycosylase n=1 Tax=Fretibacter rubidus TaxID=570162 RepID=UPI00352A183B